MQFACSPSSAEVVDQIRGPLRRIVRGQPGPAPGGAAAHPAPQEPQWVMTGRFDSTQALGKALELPMEVAVDESA